MALYDEALRPAAGHCCHTPTNVRANMLRYSLMATDA